MLIYKDMITEVLRYGTRKENRTGVDTLSTFNFNYELCWDRRMYRPVMPPNVYRLGYRLGERGVEQPVVPLLTTKKISWKNIVVELLWFLSGRTDIAFLRRHGCKFWDPWADRNGNVPSAYGHFWRRFPAHRKTQLQPEKMFNDQLSWVLYQLRNNPMSRRLVVSAWAPDNAQQSKLPPCHFAMCFNVQNNPEGEPRLCLHLTQRSCDLALGVPYNMASYGLLLLIMSRLSGIEPGIFAHTLIDLHIYTSKLDGAGTEYDHVPGLREQRKRSQKPLPTLRLDESITELSDIEALLADGVSTDDLLDAFKLEGYEPHPAIKFKVAV